MAAWSWRTWPDLLIDFGREAYVAWRLAEGDVLQRDVVTVSGPLSPYWNALLFRIFGVGLDTLFVANALLFTALVWVWYRLISIVADRTAAFLGCLVLVSLFGFAQYVGIGNYNYIAPYSHELTHGLLLASIGLLCWERIIVRRQPAAWLAAGVAFGLVALTKIEVFAAAAAANGLGFLVLLHRARAARTGVVAGAGLFAVGALAPVGIATLGLSSALGFCEATRAVTISWMRLFGDDLAALPFYQRGMGTDDVLGNLAVAALWAARIGAIFAPAAVLALALRNDRPRRPWIPLAAGAAMVAVLAPFADSIRWLQAARPLPFFGSFALVYCAVRLATHRLSRERPERLLLQAMLVAFATGLLAKIFLLGRIYQYGFALAMPGTLLFVAALVSWIPGEIQRRGGSGRVFRAAALGFLAVAIFGHALVMAPFFASKTGRLGGVHDAIRVPPAIARVVGAALEEVNARIRPGESLAVLPEGVMLNFLVRRPTPTPHFSFNPFELHVYGEDEVLRDFQSSPPGAIILVHHDTSEHGARFLGRDYGIELLAWIKSHYTTARQIGDPPLEPDSRFGISVLELRGRTRARGASARGNPDR
jgi:hypothetical protein